MGTTHWAKGHRVDTRNATLAYYDIVVVFAELRFGPVLSELARRLLPGHPAPLITEIPNQVLAVVYPDRQIQCEFANRRATVRDSRGGQPGAEPFGQVAINAVGAAREAGAPRIVAYGYNYELHMPLGNGDAGAFLRTRFFRQPDEIGQAFGGRGGPVGIGASVTLSDCEVKFDIAPIPERSGYAKAHVNYHYEGREPPPDAEALAEEAGRRCNEFRAALEKL
jgi:hypothetical protein